MVTTVPIFTGNASGQPGQNVGLKVQPSSANDGSYVPVVAIDGGGGGGGGGSETVTGTVTANAGTNLNTSALALETGGNLATLAGTVAASKVKVDPSGVTSPVSLASLPALAAGSANIGKVELTDGTNVPAVKPASTAPQATDPALVVALSPNSSLTLGSVTANAGTNLNTSALALESGGNLATVAGTVSGGKVKVDPSGVTSPVSLASLPTLAAGTNNVGKVEITDGTNVPAVKPASTAPQATDPALVVALSPNSSLTLGSVTANAGTNLNTSALALETGGNLATLAGTVAASKVKVDPSGVTSPVSLASLPTLASGTNIVGKVGIDQTTPGTTNGVQINAALPSGTNSIGTIQPGNTANTTPWLMSPSTGGNTAAVKAASTAPAATDPALVVAISPNSVNANGQATMANSAPVAIASNQSAIPTTATPSASANGMTSSRVVAAASTNATSLKTTAGNLGNIDVFNVAAYSVFLKFYNKASAPTVGTDTPVWTVPISAGTGYSRSFPVGKSFATGIAYAITKNQADSDTTATAAGDLTGAIDWI